MNSPRASRRSDTSTGGLYVKGPSHSTPVKMEGSRSMSSSRSALSPMSLSLSDDHHISPTPAHSHTSSHVSAPKATSTPNPNRHHGNHIHGDFTPSPGDVSGRSSTLSHLESCRDNLNFSDMELNYRESRSSSEHLTRSAPLPRDTSLSSSALAASVRKNLSGALGVQDSKTKGWNNASMEYDSMMLSEQASSHQAKLADFENQTIQKQRQELAMMISELRDRDRELNDMVGSHQKQMSTWEQDRKKLLSMEEKCSKLDRTLQLKNDEIRSMTAKLRVVECEEMDKSTALNNTQEQLLVMSEQQSQAELQLQDMEQRNRSLGGSMREMSLNLGQLEAREQELLTVLQLKDRDLSEASCHLAEISARLKKMELQYKEAKSEEANNRRKITDWKNKYSDLQREVDYTKKQLMRSEQRGDEQHIEIQKIRQESSTLKKELTLTGEREKRKDQLLDLAKSRQDRSDAELNNLRQLYERQQRDLSLLHLNLESTKDLLHRHHIDFPGMGSIGLAHVSPRSASYNSRSSYRTDNSYSRHHEELTDSHIETISYTPGPDEYINGYPQEADTHSAREPSPIPSTNQKSESVDDDLDIQREETPTNLFLNPQLAAVRQTSVKETDSPATKLHKLLTESRDMVEELEKTVCDKEQSSNQSSRHTTPQRATPQQTPPQRTTSQQTTPQHTPRKDIHNGSSDYNQDEFDKEPVKENEPKTETDYNINC